MKQTKYYLYKIVNKVNSKVYIGVTLNPKRRFNEHIKRTKSAISKSIRKHGKDNFDFVIIMSGPKLLIHTLEVEFIRFHRANKVGYNCSNGGEGTDRHVPWNKNTKGVCKPNKTSFSSETTTGERHKMSKVTDSQRLEIYKRMKNGEVSRDLAKEYGIHYSNVCRAVKYVERHKLEDKINSK